MGRVVNRPVGETPLRPGGAIFSASFSSFRRYTCATDAFDRAYEQFKVQGRELGEKIRELIHEGNVRRIIIKDEDGNTFLEIPLTVATIGIVAAPVLAAVGAITTLIGRFEIVVERVKPRTTASAGPTGEAAKQAKEGAAGTGERQAPGE